VLGVETVVGGRVWDRQHKFRLRLGPLTRVQYESFLPAPSGAGLAALVDWVRLYLSMELDWDAQLILRREDVPPLTLGGGPRLGWTTWLGGKPRSRDAADLCLNAEALLSRIGARAA
jgi:type VI secretion system protein ImpH